VKILLTQVAKNAKSADYAILPYLNYMNWLESGDVLSSIGEFLAEDIGRGDITTTATVPPDSRGIGRFLAKEDIVLCGIEIAEAVFFHLTPRAARSIRPLPRGMR
jgi:hypothetical protein